MLRCIIKLGIVDADKYQNKTLYTKHFHRDLKFQGFFLFNFKIITQTSVHNRNRHLTKSTMRYSPESTALDINMERSSLDPSKVQLA